MTGHKVAVVLISPSARQHRATALPLKSEAESAIQSGPVKHCASSTLSSAVLVDSRVPWTIVASSRPASVKIALNIMDLDPDVLTMHLRQAQLQSATKWT